MGFAIYTSTTHDGSMKALTNEEERVVEQNRTQFLAQHALSPADTTRLMITYDRDDYCQYNTISDTERGDGITRPSTFVADALVVTQPGHALFLALADCVGTVLYDAVRGVLMVSHLGRHSLEQQGGTKSVHYLVEHHRTDPKNLQVWLSPAAGKTHYPLRAFDGQSLHQVATEQLVTAGVPKSSIDISPVDTTTNLEYFSHSEFQKGNRPTDGRFAIVAVMD